MDEQIFRENLSRYIDGELDEEFRKEIEVFVQENPLAQLELENEKKVDALLRKHIIKEKAPFALREAVIRRLEISVGRKSVLSPLISYQQAIFASTVVIVILFFVIKTPFSTTFPVYSEAVSQHIEYLKGSYPLEIRTNSVEEAVAWFKDKVDFAVSRPHIDPQKTNFVGARIVHLKDKKVAYFMFEKDGHNISAFVMDLSRDKIPKVAAIYNNPMSSLYVKNERGFRSFLCFHKLDRIGCAIVSDLPEEEVLKILG